MKECYSDLTEMEKKYYGLQNHPFQYKKKIGADIIIPLDQLLPNNVNYKKLVKALERTHMWERRSLNKHLENKNNQAMFGVIHGGTDIALRKNSIDFIASLPFDGFAIGGSLGKNHEEMVNLLRDISPFLPNQNKPLHLLGIGDENGIRKTVEFGIDTFDSVYPIRIGRHGNLLSENGLIKFSKSIYKGMVNDPLIEGCECPSCKILTKGFFHHLIKHHESIYSTYGSIHNLYYMNKLMEKIRNDILVDKI